MKKKILFGAVFAAATLVLGLIGYIVIIFAGEYVIDEKKLVMDSTSVLVDQEGNEISKLYIKNRELVEIKDVPKHVQHAFISVEDARFYKHHGIDARAILRALYKDILAGGRVEGGSTITQQLAKNVFLTQDKTFLRKTKEAIISINLERNYSKDKLLEMYLNQIYFGHGAYGIQAASKLYFNKPVSELTAEEGALLAALPKAPSTYSPVSNPEKAKQRRDLILSLMEKQGFLTAEEAVRLQGKTVAIQLNKKADNPAFITYIDMVLDEAKEKYHLSNEEVLTGGYNIVVPMQKSLQQVSYQLFQDASNFPGTDQRVQGSFVMMNSKTGGVLAVQGGRDYVHKGLNRVTKKRQPGSVIKPLVVYGPALDKGKFHPYSMLVDEPLAYDGYQPKNYDGNYDGQISMYDALVHSDNAPAVWLLNELGIEAGKQYLSKAGIDIPDNGLAIALGGLKEGISPIDLASAYRAFADAGKTVEPYFIEKLYDRSGELIEREKRKEHKVFSKQTAWYMTRMLEAVVSEGTGKAGHYKGALAGKTGTTSYPKVEGASMDAWFAGYTPEAVGVLWMGYDRTTEKHYLKGGSSYAASLFKKILNEANYKGAKAFSKPKGVAELEKPIRLPVINDLKGKLVFRLLDLLSVELTWTPDEDPRVAYRIYEVNDSGQRRLVDTVTGTGTYTVGDFNLFKNPDYLVVPYNELTKVEGKASNQISIKALSDYKINMDGVKTIFQMVNLW